MVRNAVSPDPGARGPCPWKAISAYDMAPMSSQPTSRVSSEEAVTVSHHPADEQRHEGVEARAVGADLGDARDEHEGGDDEHGHQDPPRQRVEAEAERQPGQEGGLHQCCSSVAMSVMSMPLLR